MTDKEAMFNSKLYAYMHTHMNNFQTKKTAFKNISQAEKRLLLLPTCPPAIQAFTFHTRVWSPVFPVSWKRLT